MSLLLTDELRQALESPDGEPVRLVDEQTRRVYYVISSELFEAAQALLSTEPFDPREMYPLIARTAAAAGWDDPSMDDYDRYDELAR
jgi:hypothetical protein